MSWLSHTSKVKTQFQLKEQPNKKSLEQISLQVAMNIQSIEKFYNLNSQKKLIQLILDKKASQRLFNPKPSSILSLFQDTQKIQAQKQEKRIKFFSEKYTYEALVQKFPKPKSGTNDLLIKILQKKMQTHVITSHQTRKSIWLLASGAKFNMINNKDLYQGLLSYNDYPSYFERSINQDLHRTVNKATSPSQTIQQEINKLKNVLTAFSRRNPFIGYCQGLNFIAFFLLTMQFTEQEAFWLLSTILQSIVPMDYYTNMIGVVCDQQIFINILKIQKPHIVAKFDELGLDPSILSIQWFVCLFTSSLPFYSFKLVKIVWDRLLVQGTRAFIKTGLIILSYFEDSIMEANQFHEIIMILQKGSKSLKVAQTIFNAQFQTIYIDKKGLKLARGLYREYHLKEKLNEKVITNRPKNVQVKCDLKWPICSVKLQKVKRQRQELDVWIYRSENSPKIIHDYLLKSNIFEKKISITSSMISTNGSNNSFNGKKNKKSQQNLSYTPVSTVAMNCVEDQIKENNFKQDQNVFYQVSNKNSKQNQFSRKKIQKIQVQDFNINTSRKKASDLIIGRIEHVCYKQRIQEAEKVEKANKYIKKRDNKFLSMILEDGEQIKNQTQLNKIQYKRTQTYKKIKQCSQIFLDQQKISKTSQEKIPLQNNGNLQFNVEQKPQVKFQSQIRQSYRTLNQRERQQRLLLARSRTINFYNEFIQNNKQLSFIISNGLQNGNNNNNDQIEQKQLQQQEQSSQEEQNQQKQEQNSNQQEKHKEEQVYRGKQNKLHKEELKIENIQNDDKKQV